MCNMEISVILDYLRNMKIPFTFTGDAAADVVWFSSLSQYRAGTFTWIKKQESIPAGMDLAEVRLAFVSEDVVCTCPNLICTAMSKHAFFSTIEHFYAVEETYPPIGQFTYLSPKVKLGKNVRVGHNCTLDGEITVGDNTVIWNGVTILHHVTIGHDCDIHSGAVIGHDGFGFTEDENHVKTMVKHFGGVSIGDGVLIGENVCISRGTIDDTVLGNGVKIDSLSHIAHNCRLEENVNLSAPCQLNGSVHVGKNAYIAGGIVRNQCSVGENTFIGLGAVVVKTVPNGQTVVGNPARPHTMRKDPRVK